MVKKRLIIFSVLVICFVFVSAGCSKSYEDRDTPSEPTVGQESSLVSRNVPEEFRAGTEEVCAERGLTVDNVFHTVDYGDHIVLFFLGKKVDDTPIMLTISFCKDSDDGDYYAGSYEYSDAYDYNHYGADIPAMYRGKQDYDYGSRWMIDTKEALDEYMGDDADFKYQIKDNAWIYIDEDEEGGRAFELYNGYHGLT